MRGARKAEFASARRRDLAAASGCLVFTLALAVGWNWAVHASHWVGMTALIAAVAAFVAGARLGALSWMALGAFLLAPYAPLFAPSFDAPPPPGCSLTALTFNTKLTRKADEERIAAVFGAHAADIVFAQEAIRPDAFMAAVRAQPGLRGVNFAFDPRGTGLSVFSRFALEPRGIAEGFAATATIAGQRVLLATTLGSRAHEDEQPAATLRRFADAVAAARLPVLIGADLNAGPRSEPALALGERFDDAWLAKGFGFGDTFAAPGRAFGAVAPLLRVDYLLSSAEIVATSVAAPSDYGGSTHYPVRGEFVFAGKGAAGGRCAG
jgi:endonuclease/exonuclease/phosphatase family metal-dependent hydrolase